ncbi:MAG: hypothetical protein KY467_16605 [Gemmatimonadetes bacterium]|nr:hypothetical protein [Gemmatimonadota bacterium]
MSSLEREATRTHGAPAAELLGIVFTTPKSLRHSAEQVLGQDFIPTEVLSEDERTADLVLRPTGMPEIHVHAERARHWYPYEITHVEDVER